MSNSKPTQDSASSALFSCVSRFTVLVIRFVYDTRKNNEINSNRVGLYTNLLVNNLRITCGLPRQTVGQHVHNRVLTHRVIFTNVSFAQILQKFYTQVIPLLFSVFNRLNLSFMHRFHTANNNYYINK